MRRLNAAERAEAAAFGELQAHLVGAVEAYSAIGPYVPLAGREQLEGLGRAIVCMSDALANMLRAQQAQAADDASPNLEKD